MITVWHKDPEKDGTDDSCDFSGFRKSRENGWCPAVEDDFKNLPEEAQRVVNYIWWAFKDKLTSRRWWQHPRFHIWHWRIQIHFILTMKRFLFSRCQKCGKKFSWGESVIGTWSGRGPGWFRNAEKVWHMDCDRPAKPVVASAN
jgi:hypothetical protein